MKKNDFILISVILSFSIITLLIFSFLGKSGGDTVTVKQNNQTVYSGNLSYDKTIELKGNTVTIKNKTVYMESADCKNQICVRHKKISKKGESIICLPNKVIIEIE